MSNNPLSRVGAVHDALSRATFVLGAFVCGAIAVCLCYEVASRYFFGAPTRWANPFSNFGLCIAIFAALPELTRQGAHVSVNILLARAPREFSGILQRAILVVSAAACFMAAYIGSMETWRQFQNGITTISAIEVPKWYITIFIAYGLASAGIYFLRELATFDLDAFLKKLTP